MFRIGQKVVCVVAATPGRDYPGAEVGQTYTVREMVRCPVYKREGVYLQEITLPIHPHHNMEAGFYASRFRPVVEKSTDAGMAILREILERETIKDHPKIPTIEEIARAAERIFRAS